MITDSFLKIFNCVRKSLYSWAYIWNFKDDCIHGPFFIQLYYTSERSSLWDTNDDVKIVLHLHLNVAVLLSDTRRKYKSHWNSYIRGIRILILAHLVYKSEPGFNGYTISTRRCAGTATVQLIVGIFFAFISQRQVRFKNIDIFSIERLWNLYKIVKVSMKQVRLGSERNNALQDNGTL